MTAPETVPDEANAGLVLVNLSEWLKNRQQPRGRPAGTRPILTPEEHAEVPLTPEERQRRALLLARLREANHPRR